MSNSGIQSAGPRSKGRGRRSRPQEATAPQTLSGKGSRTGLRNRNASALVVDKKEQNPKSRSGRRKTNGEETTQDTEEVLELLGSTSAPMDSVVFQSGTSSAENPLQDKASASITAEPSLLANADADADADADTDADADVNGDDPIPLNHEEVQPSPSNTTFE